MQEGVKKQTDALEMTWNTRKAKVTDNLRFTTTIGTRVSIAKQGG